MHADGLIVWRCERCGLGPITLRASELPVHHACGQARVVVDDIACVYRGEVIGHRTCETCGLRGVAAPVHRCSLLDVACVVRPWTLRRSQMPENPCITCRERTLVDGSKPWSALVPLE